MPRRMSGPAIKPISMRHRFLSCLAFAFAGLFAAPPLADNHFTVGGEGFRDTYKEYNDLGGPAPHVDIHSDYGSVTATYEHSNDGYFTAVDGRYSWGNADYKSISGTINNT